MSRLFSKALGYTVPILLNSIVSLLTIPALVLIAGPEEWARVAVAQAAGSLGAVVVGFGWGAIGPATVAGLQAAERGAYFSRSLVPRLALLALVLPALSVIVYFVAAPRTFDEGVGGVLISWGMASAGMSAAWYFVAESAPWRVVLFDMLPRVICTMLAVGALYLTGQLAWFGAVFLLGHALSGFIASRVILRSTRSRVQWMSGREIVAILRGSLPAFTSSATSALYANAPLLMLSVLNPAGLTTYALADKIYRFAITAVQPVTQIAQGYVPAAGPDQIWTRAKRASVATAGCAIIFAIGFVLVSPWLGGVLSAHKIELDIVVVVALGLAGMCVIMSRYTGLTLLVTIGQLRSLAQSTVIGAVTGVALSILLALLLAGCGVALAVLTAEVLVLIVQVIMISRFRRFSVG